MKNIIKDIYVAEIIDSDIIVINKGVKDLIEDSMRFLVYEDREEIFDPITKGSLGKLEKPKGFFKVQHIQEKMTVLVSELRREKNLFSNLLIQNDLTVERDLLKTIKIGDKVKIINII
jgi:hypothetical protein